jgi:hypothetical protein
VAAYRYPPPEDDPEMDVDLKPFKVCESFSLPYFLLHL